MTDINAPSCAYFLWNKRSGVIKISQGKSDWGEAKEVSPLFIYAACHLHTLLEKFKFTRVQGGACDR